MLAVAYPHMCGLGGDLFLLHYDRAQDEVACLNASGPAPTRASTERYRESGLHEVPVRGPLAATVPGTVAGWEAALRRFGRSTLGELLMPAARAAAAGVEVTERLAGWIERTPEIENDPTLAARFLDRGAPLATGARLRQPELAATLTRLAEVGAADFYCGQIADAIGTAFDRAGGLLTRQDLEAYEPQWVEPARCSYRGHEIVTTPPNSQGVTALLMLRALEELDAAAMRLGSAAYVEVLTKAKLAAFAVRDEEVGDPAFGAGPAEQLLDRDLLPRPDSPLTTSGRLPPGGDTVYLCTLDADGNACSLIQSIYYGFGSCFVAGDTGVLMHNRAHAFSLEPGHPNRLQPGRRPLHTLMASLAFEGGELRHVFGSMGADGQPQFNVQVLDRLLAGSDPQEAVAAPRVLHGRFVLEDSPTTLHLERDLGTAPIEALAAAGHRIEVVPPESERMGHAHAITIDPSGRVMAGSDPRSDGDTRVLG
jgi:gamma-glutamyltranspeptidase/glutathione hydrolase